MTAPGLLGPFDTGFLLANRPAAFINTKPFSEWTQGTIPARWASLARISAYAKGRIWTCTPTRFAKCSTANTTRFVDKTPAYWEKLELILRRARARPSSSSTRRAPHRWQKRHAGEASFRGCGNRFTWQLGLAQRHPPPYGLLRRFVCPPQGPDARSAPEFLGEAPQQLAGRS